MLGFTIVCITLVGSLPALYALDGRYLRSNVTFIQNQIRISRIDFRTNKTTNYYITLEKIQEKNKAGKGIRGRDGVLYFGSLLRNTAITRKRIEGKITIEQNLTVLVRQIIATPPITKDGGITFKTLLFKKGGNISVANETFNIMQEDIIIRFTVARWDFCHPCGKEYGTHLELSFSINITAPIKEKKAAEIERKTKGQHYDLGQHVELILPRKVKLNSDWKPTKKSFLTVKYEKNKRKSTFDFTIPRSPNIVYEVLLVLSSGQVSSKIGISLQVKLILLTTLPFRHLI